MQQDLDLKSVEELKELLAVCHRSSGMLAKTLFPDRFFRPFSPEIHGKIFEIIDDDSIKKAVIAAPRGVGKSSIVNLVLPARGILYRESRHIIPISCSADAAIEQSENLKAELETNELVLKLFGSCRSRNWSQEKWDTYWADDPTFSTRVRPRGAGQQVRGRLFRNYRPDLIIIDDLEDPEHVDSPEQRRKKKEWFFADVMNSIDRGSKDWRIIVLGTYLHEDSLLANLLEDPTWTSVRLEICNDELRSNWPEYMTDGEIAELYESLRSQNLADVFFREFRNLPVSTHDSVFRQEYFRYYDEVTEGLDKRKFIEHAILVEPAKSAQIHSSDSAIICTAVDTHSNAIYVREIEAGKFHPDEIYDKALRMACKYKVSVIGVEVTGLNEFITYPFRNEMLRRGLHFVFADLKARRGAARGEGKDERIASLVSFYRKGLIFHNKNCCMGLEAQLLSFPRSKRKDIMDCLAYIVELLEMGDRYFKSTYADDLDLEEDEFKALMKETEAAIEWERVV